MQMLSKRCSPFPHHFEHREELVVATGIYIDGLNLYYGALRNTPYRWLDLEHFCHVLLPNDEISTIRYFTAPIYLRQDTNSRSRQSVYLRALRTIPTVQVHLGHFISTEKWRAIAENGRKPSELFQPRFRPERLFRFIWDDARSRRQGDANLAKIVIEQEKGTDVNLAAHLINDCARNHIDRALVISNDSDLSGAIQIARTFVDNIGILNPHMQRTSSYLKKSAKFEIHLRESALSRSQFPQTLIDTNGKQISRPRVWK